jgi:hypothetical protein
MIELVQGRRDVQVQDERIERRERTGRRSIGFKGFFQSSKNREKGWKIGGNEMKFGVVKKVVPSFSPRRAGLEPTKEKSVSQEKVERKKGKNEREKGRLGPLRTTLSTL